VRSARIAALRFAGLLLAAATAAQSGAPNDATAAALAEAEQQLAAARAEREAASLALEAVIEELKDDFLALTVGPAATTLRHELVLALHDALPSARARLAAETAKGRAVLRGTRRQLLLDTFNEALASAAPGLDRRFKAWIARNVAEALSARENYEGIEQDTLLGLVAPLLPAGRNWYGFWNESFREGQPEAQRWAAAWAAYERAGLALDRLRNPERYGARGEVAPPGMIIVPGGAYDLGPNAGWERSSRRVSLKAFALDRREVTEREYALFVDAQPPSARPALLPRGWELDADNSAKRPAATRDLPVIFVSWNQAAAYAAWAGKRLPTEDEWEAAAGGTAGLAYPWGNTWRDDAANGVHGPGRLLPVESFAHAPAPCGALDMAGNAWEWTATLESGENITALPAGLVNVVIRGGGFNSRREELAVRYRWTAPGQDTFASPRYDRPIGFRCAKDP